MGIHKWEGAVGRKRKYPKHKQKKPKWYQKENEWGDFVFDWSLGLPGEVWRIIFALFIIIVATIVLMGFFGSAGQVGAAFVLVSKRLFGTVGAFLFAVSILYLGAILLVPPKSGYKISRFIGIGLFLISVMVFIHLFIPEEEALEAVQTSRGGGYVGYLVSTPLRQGIGLFPTFLVSVALTFISILMITHYSLPWLSSGDDEEENDAKSGKVNVNTGSTKVSVFESVRRRLGTIKKTRDGHNAAPVIEAAPMNLSASLKKDTAWEYPPVDILKDSDEVASSGNINKNAEIIQKTLKNFNIEVTLGDVNIGPTVTQYTLKPSEGVKLNQIVARQNDLALALSAQSLRVEAPIPGKNLVGLEIPNKIPAKVTLREVLVSKEIHAVKSKLALAMGRDVAGEPVAIDLEKMPHMLIAGATGSGKSICINAVIITLLYNNSPADLRLILVDPKRVELTGFNGIPHLLTPVVTEVDKTVSTLKWAVYEMERRYELFAKLGKRNITAYNAAPGEGGKMPYIVIVIDELADLMATSAKEVEGSIVRLAQMARATGIHLIVATQRPSVDVLTGLIKANIPCRVAFATASQVDSRTILDMSGAEKLLGRGDMLFVGNGVDKPRRIQGCFVSDQEIESVNEFLKGKSPAQYDESIMNFRAARTSGVVGGESSGEDDLYDEAVETVVRAGKASASLLQRRLRVGYARAARLLDLLEEAGVIGPADGAKPRDILVAGNDSGMFRSEQGGSNDDYGGNDERNLF
ncbi:MAG: DNA translocase FtsK 4TM domain-containing protein [Patescibacteria group bacterium]|jgi:S-DNA-T family DNA segregation ATPase FtsK/SpoIIIE